MSRNYKRTILFTKISVFTTICMILGKLIVGLYSKSFFIIFSAFYSLGLGLAKILSLKVYNESIKKLQPDGTIKYGKEEYNCYLLVGIIVLASGIFYICYCARMFLGFGGGVKYSMNTALAIAAFTFTEIGISIRGAIITKKDKEPVLEAIKLANVASSFILLVLTQTAIMSFASETDNTFYNGLAGMVFGAVAMLIGLYMVIHISIKINKLKQAEIEYLSNDTNEVIDEKETRNS